MQHPAPTLRNIRPGDIIGADNLNRVADYLNRTSNDFPGPNLQSWQVLTIFVAKALVGADADFTDARYWIQPQVNQPQTYDTEASILNLVPDQSSGGLNSASQNPLIGINIGELASGAHTAIVDGQFVVVLGIMDTSPSKTYPIERYIIISGGGTSDTSIGQYQDTIRMMVADNQVGFQFLRACQLVV